MKHAQMTNDITFKIQSISCDNEAHANIVVEVKNGGKMAHLCAVSGLRLILVSMSDAFENPDALGPPLAYSLVEGQKSDVGIAPESTITIKRRVYIPRSWMGSEIAVSLVEQSISEQVSQRVLDRILWRAPEEGAWSEYQGGFRASPHESSLEGAGDGAEDEDNGE